MEGLVLDCNGFTQALSTSNSIISLLTQVNYCLALVVFLNLEKAFELASPHAIFATLATFHTPLKKKILSGAQQMLDLIMTKCEEELPGLKILAERSWDMSIETAIPMGQLSIQGIRLAWTFSLLLSFCLCCYLNFSVGFLQLQYHFCILS
ncbi:hypothetical protein E2C01_045005 [Portunus trituberculatus]|uniref:Uncharacterized protein n=1 Tax=Portunus trituberculatus TaxID=210409 RepID=A0A5B7G0V8_PORTR|nr:hypothetical protein [Portunus trituberculatus]